MCGRRNPRALAPPRALIVNRRLAGPVAHGLLGCLECDRTHIREEYLFVSAREDLEGLFQRQPFHRLDIVHRLAHRSADGSHMPKLYDLDPAIYRIQIVPRNPWTETSCPVSSNTSRLAAASAFSPG